MTTLRQKKQLRKYIDRAPDDRLRHCEGEIDEYMAGKEPSVEAVRLCIKGALILLVLLAIYAASGFDRMTAILQDNQMWIEASFFLTFLGLAFYGSAFAIFFKRLIVLRFKSWLNLPDVAHMKFDERGDPTEQADADYRGWKPRDGR